MATSSLAFDQKLLAASRRWQQAPQEQTVRKELLDLLNGRRQRRAFELSPARSRGILALLFGNTRPSRHDQAVFFGRSSLPFMDRFETHFYVGRGRRIYGRTVTGAEFLIGPGYFRAVKDRRRRGALVVRYDELPPPADVPEGWPAVRPNDHGAASAPYGGVEIVLRQADEGILSGEVWKRTRQVGANVVLLRG